MALERDDAGEPALDDTEIQGNVVPGFLKPHMAVIGLRIDDAAAAKRWLASMVPRVTTLRQAMGSREAVRRHRLRHPMSPAASMASWEEDSADLLNPRPELVDDSWFNIAFSHAGLGALLGSDPARTAEIGAFEPAFRLGLPARSSLLGDPTDPAAEGHPSRWVVGAPGDGPDVLAVVAADRWSRLVTLRDEVTTSAAASGLTAVYREDAAKLTGRGSEHFGFKDGISQPGVRGRWGQGGDPVTPRLIQPARQPEASLYGLPGQHLVWPGEFVFGYPGQGADPMLPGAVRLPGPPWSRNGSMLVFRRLRQDVAAFRAFIAAAIAQLAGRPGFSDLDATELASYLVGRWPSGAPIARAPDHDDIALGADRLANNNFAFGADSVALPLTEGSDAHRLATSDPLGLVCPLAAHIRKVNNRDAVSDIGGRRAAFTRRILRRGLPFGPLLPDDGDDPVRGNRGLLFLSYQTSIAGQFEFLMSQWMGDVSNPAMPSGHDLVVGQNGQPGEGRRRRACIARRDASGQVVVGEVDAAAEWVIPTGGGYFFSPSISALRDVLSA